MPTLWVWLLRDIDCDKLYLRALPYNRQAKWDRQVKQDSEFTKAYTEGRLVGFLPYFRRACPSRIRSSNGFSLFNSK